MSFFYKSGGTRILYRVVFCLSMLSAGMLLSRPGCDAVKAWFFCRPAALAIAALTGGELSFSEQEAIITTPGLRLIVPPSCSGTNFFLILTASLFWALSECRKRWWTAVIPAAYLITLTSNSVRIIAVSRWEIHCAPCLPLPLPLQHMAVGMSIFLPTLLAVYLLTISTINHIQEGGHGN